MKDMINMVLVLTVLALVSGGALAKVQQMTEPLIKKNQLEFVKGPALREILSDAENNPIEDRFSLVDGEKEVDVFVGQLDGAYKIVAIESSGKGYAGDVGLFVAVDLETDKVYGVGVTTHSETAGLGSKAKDDPNFAAQFKELDIDKAFVVSGDGQKINAIGGATITSKAVCAAATQAGEMYLRLKPQFSDKLKELAQ